MEKNRSFLGALMRGDAWIWGIYWFLFIISIVEISSATSSLAYRASTNDNPLVRHTMFLVFGFFFLVLIFQALASRRPKSIEYIGWFSYIVGVVLMLLMPIFGHEVNGAKRDILGVQPVEFCKLGLIISLCSVINMKDESLYRWKFFRSRTKLHRYYLMLAMIFLAAFPILLQNLSSALILGLVSLFIMYLGNVKLSYLLKTLGMLAALGGLFLLLLFWLHNVNLGRTEDVNLGILQRANTWEHRIFDKDEVPLVEQEINDDNMQEIYAHMAIANSDVYGKFFGNSQMRDYLPQAYSDYIYAIIFEETGITGAIIVMLVYFILLWRCYKISLRTQDPVKRLLMLGIPLLIIVQALIHMGVSTGAMFVTGQPLPLVSRGGMSILGTSVCFGILCGLSHSIQKEVRK